MMAGFYAVYHGPKGLKSIALNIHHLTKKLHNFLFGFHHTVKLNSTFFNTLTWELSSSSLALKIYNAFQKENINVGFPKESALSFTFHEGCTEEDLLQIQSILEKSLSKSSSSAVKKKSLVSSDSHILEAIPKSYVEKQCLSHPSWFLISITQKLNFYAISITFKIRNYLWPTL